VKVQRHQKRNNEIYYSRLLPENEMNIDDTKMNYTAVVVTGLMAFALSLLWYSPLLFGNIWTALRDAPVNPLPRWTFAFAALREISTAFLLAYLIVRLRIANWKSALGLGLGLWFAFYFVQLTGAVLWDNKPWQLGMVHGGDWLMKMLFMSVVLRAWHSNNHRLTERVHENETPGSLN
jgi:hypothetical protein